MIKISAAEAAYLRKAHRGWDVHTVNITHKSRHKEYYLTESDKSMALLKKYRESHLIETYVGR